MAIAVLFDRADAERFVAERPAAAHAVLPLTPVAARLVRDVGLRVINPRDAYTDGRQARTVARVEQARAKLRATLDTAQEWTLAASAILCDAFEYLAPSAVRLEYTLARSGPWLVPTGGGWREIFHSGEACRLLFAEILAPVAAMRESNARIRKLPLPALYRLLRAPLLVCVCRGRILLFGARKSQFGLFERLAADPGAPRPVLLTGVEDGWRGYLRLARAYLALARPHSLLQVGLVPEDASAWGARIDRVLEALPDSTIRAAFVPFRAALSARIASMEALRSEASHAIRALQPEAYCSSEISRPIEWLIADECGKLGVPRVVMGRNAQIPGNDAISRAPAQAYFLARYPTALTDEFLVWSPHGIAAARRFVPRAKQGGIRAFRGVPVAPAAPAVSRTLRRVLIADSFGIWWSKNSWIHQTSDEFVDGLRHLIHALADLPATELIVRLKHKTECDLETVVALVEPSQNCFLKVRDVPFAEDIKAADLLVSFYSSVVQEAIHARRPVLLFGGTSRCHYLPARNERPTPADRAPLYVCADARELRAMVAAILDVHAGRPLTDAEITPHVFGPDVPDVAAVTRSLASRCAGKARSPVATAHGDTQPV